MRGLPSLRHPPVAAPVAQNGDFSRVLPQIHRQAIRANRTGNIVYLNNPKVGCSTAKFNLWLALDPDIAGRNPDVHSIAGSPFTDDLAALDWIETARIFTFVRNPFVRVVSAYLNKIAGQEPAQWDWFVRRYKVPADRVLPFDAFIRLISDDCPEDLDPHWRPQHLNLMYPFVQPNVIGKLERMDEELPQILTQFLATPAAPPRRKTQHGTDAAQSFQSYFRDPDTLRRVISLYYEDFAHFGYALDPAAPVAGTALPPVSERISDHGHPRLAALAALRRETAGPARQAVVERVAALVATDPATARDDNIRAWLLHARLDGGRGPDAELALVRDNLGTVLKGPEYLRRAAGRVTATQGAWHLCNRIAGASLR